MKSRLFYVSSSLLIGIAICVSVWFFFQGRKAKELHRQNFPSSSNDGITTQREESEKLIQRIRNRITTDKRNSLQRKENEESLAERITQRVRNNIRSIYSEKQLADPEIQKRLAVYDSPAFLEFMKDVDSTEMTERKWNDFWESQGFPVHRDYTKIFRNSFPTGEPEDYEREMRLKFARLFIAQEPVDLTNPLAAARQRGRVIHEVFRELNADMAWYLGQFGDDWDTAVHIKREGEPRSLAREWLTNVQRNAASIVAAAEATGGDVLETQAPVPLWDMSSVMESSPVSPDAMEGNRPSMAAPSTEADEQYDTAKRTAAAPIVDPEKGVTDALPPLPESSTVEELETALRKQFVLDRFERAMSTLERYGPEEGLRRLRENDPEVANQIEQHRNQEESSR